MHNDTHIQFRFDNSYRTLPAKLFEECNPTAVAQPQLIILNEVLAKDLGLNFNGISNEEVAEFLSGNRIIEGAQPIAQAYAGHQFGYFNMLGDGRAILLGEHITPFNQRFDIQLKGSGETPYSRRGDGRATLSSMLREYIISEAMFALQIPTTRSLAVVSTGEEVHREYTHEGAVLTRIAASHIRVGTFEFVRRFNDVDTFKAFTNYTIQRHYPHLLHSENYALNFLKEVMEKQIDLIVNWMRVGFIHGVMNTDNTAISGESFDYGPCAFMNQYHPQTVFSSIDTQGRYAFGNQGAIIQWNLIRLTEALLPLIDPSEAQAIDMAKSLIQGFEHEWHRIYQHMMAEKIGFTEADHETERLVYSLLKLMEEHGTDYTNTFAGLCHSIPIAPSPWEHAAFMEWKKEWNSYAKNKEITLEERKQLMSTKNPVIIPRNHLVESILSEVEYWGKDTSYSTRFNEALAIWTNPYRYDESLIPWMTPPTAEANQAHQTYCGT